MFNLVSCERISGSQKIIFTTHNINITLTIFSHQLLKLSRILNINQTRTLEFLSQYFICAPTQITKFERTSAGILLGTAMAAVSEELYLFIPFHLSGFQRHLRALDLTNCSFQGERERITCKTNFWSTQRLAMEGWKSGLSRKRRKNSYTS